VQQSLTSLRYVAPAGLKISCVPWIGDIAGAVGEIHEEVQFAFRVAAADAAYVPEVGAVHADEHVVSVIVVPPKLPRGLALAVDAVLCEFAPGGRVDRVADLLRAGGGGGDGEVAGQAAAGGQILHDEFSHGAAADVAVANEKYFYHIFYIPS